MQTWSEHGYSHVSVRNVARRTRFSHGMVHYYFSSKDALVAECVRMLSSNHTFAAADLEGAHDLTSYSERLAAAIAGSFRENRQMHRIRYDLRNQSQFDPALRSYADELEKIRFERNEQIERRYREFGWTFDPPFSLLAAQIDALIERAVREDSFGALDAAADLHRDLLQILPKND
ncbi:TetR family transcriptional regulator [Flexivirga sp. ID2601S]|uniref:TetR family transcriptional regulator n=1 Tax=Flexivirga aerilata TaxID=1656889 RepID=A0A849ANI2_9MICO|nr:TetR/AcrR family transcriptional regulator [Flexivirga aerilata]NNG38362.1 TetR family transcriptional regulator [Flexivirga aerilata]